RLDLLGEIFHADQIGAGGLGCRSLVARSEHRNAHLLAGARGEHHRAAHRLVALLRVDAEVDRDIDRLVELRRGGLLDEVDRLDRSVGLARIDLGKECLPALGDVRHYMPSTMTPIERALPATMRMAASRSAALRSGIFALAISSTCFRVILPTLSVCGLGLPDSMPAAFLISTVVGGV